MRICCLIVVQHRRSENNGVSIVFPQNASQNCCSSVTSSLLSSKGNSNRFDLYVRFFTIIRKTEFGVLDPRV